MLHIQTAVLAARNASQARIMLKVASAMLTGGYHTGIDRAFADLLAKDAGGAQVQEVIGADGAAFALRHTLKGADLKTLRADIRCIQETARESLPKKVDAKEYQLDTQALAPALMDMSIQQLAKMAEQTGVKVVIHNGVVSMGTGKLAIKVDVSDGQVLSKDEAAVRAVQGKLNALAYILSKGGKLTKTQTAVLEDARAHNATCPGTFNIPNAMGVLS